MVLKKAFFLPRSRVPPKYKKLSDFFAKWGKLLPWIALWKNDFIIEIALKLWSRRAAQFLRVL